MCLCVFLWSRAHNAARHLLSCARVGRPHAKKAPRKHARVCEDRLSCTALALYALPAAHRPASPLHCTTARPFAPHPTPPSAPPLACPAAHRPAVLARVPIQGAPPHLLVRLHEHVASPHLLVCLHEHVASLHLLVRLHEHAAPPHLLVRPPHLRPRKQEAQRHFLPALRIRLQLFGCPRQALLDLQWQMRA